METKTKKSVFGKIDLPTVKNIILVASGKGGVGKSTVAANLAVALSKTGAKTALVDADIYGPSIPLMFDVEGEKPEVINMNGKSLMKPIEKYGIKLISIGFILGPEIALIWRGPMASKALSQLFNETEWGDIDYMVIDLPPGTGDVPITIAQKLDVKGAIIVTTPQNVAIADVMKATNMFLQDSIDIPIIGIIENMAYFSPPDSLNEKYYLFGKGGGKRMSEYLHIPLLGQIPINQNICESGEKGEPIANINEDNISNVFIEIARNIMKQNSINVEN